MNDLAPLVRFAMLVTDEQVDTRAQASDILDTASDERIEDGLRRLTDRIDASAGQRQTAALETLSAAVDSPAVSVAVPPQPVVDALQLDGRSGMIAATVVRSLSPPKKELGHALTDEDVAIRRGAAAFLGLTGIPEPAQEAVVEAIGDSDATVRAGVAKGIFKSARSHRDSATVDEPLTNPALVDRLAVAATTDDDPRVRGWAALALAFLACKHELGDNERTLETVATVIADDDLRCQTAIELLVGNYMWVLDGSQAAMAGVTAAVLCHVDPARFERMQHGELFSPEVLSLALDQLDGEAWNSVVTDPERLAAMAMAGDPFDGADRIAKPLIEGIEAVPRQATEGLLSITEGTNHLSAAIPRLAGLAGDESRAATEALASVADAHPTLVADHWETVMDALSFQGERAQISAEVVAAVAEDSPDAVSMAVADAASVLYAALDTPEESGRVEIVENLVALGRADAQAVPTGIEPFLAGDVDDGREPLMVIGGSDPERVAQALSSLVASLDSDPDYSRLTTVADIAEAVPEAAAMAAPDLVALLARPWQGRYNSAREQITDTVLASGVDPAVIETHSGALTILLTNGYPAVHESAARLLRTVGQTDPNSLGPSLAPLAEGEQGEDWPIDVLAESAPMVLDRLLANTVSGDRHLFCVAEVLQTATAYRPEATEQAVVQLVERAHSRGTDSSLWNRLEALAEQAPELAALGLNQTVETLFDSLSEQRGRHVVAVLVPLAERYPERVWALLERHDDHSEPSTLPERANYRLEEDIETIVELASPD
jgi:hypothetical protein